MQEVNNDDNISDNSESLNYYNHNMCMKQDYLDVSFSNCSENGDGQIYGKHRYRDVQNPKVNANNCYERGATVDRSLEE